MYEKGGELEMINTLDYINFSKLAYIDFNANSKGRTLSSIIEKQDSEIKAEDLSSPDLSALANPGSSLRSWTLIDFQPNTASGFSGAAFKSPTGEIVFAFRGTEPEGLTAIKDFSTDLDILMGRMPQQFSDAKAFVQKIQQEFGTGVFYTCTGHSLGGGIAQYISFAVNNMHAETFNAIGIANTLENDSSYDPNRALTSYNVTNHVNMFDWVGNYGIPKLGITVYHSDRGDIDYAKVDFYSLNKMLITQSAFEFGLVSKAEAVAAQQYVLSKIEKELYDTNATLAVFNGYFGINDNTQGDLTRFHGLGNLLNIATGQLNPTPNNFENAENSIAVMNFIGAMTVIKKSREEASFDGDVDDMISVNDSYRKYISGQISFTQHPLYLTVTYSDHAVKKAYEIVYEYFRKSHADIPPQVVKIYELSNPARPQLRDPLIFDLDGDGIETTSIDSSTTFFDMDVNGFAEQTSWAARDDGLLVMDRNDDGIINDAKELFGDQTLLADGSVSKSGYQALAELDGNNDGKIDSNDSSYGSLRIWQDTDSDGITDPGELKILESLGIASISTTYSEERFLTPNGPRVGWLDSWGNTRMNRGSYTTQNGENRLVGEYYLIRNPSNSSETLSPNITQSIADLPNISGSGNVTALHNAIASDNTGALRQLVEQFIAQTDEQTRLQTARTLLIKWTASENIEPASRGAYVNAQELSVIEKFSGMPYIGTDRTGLPTATNAIYIQSAYSELLEYTYASLMSQTHLKPLFSSFGVNTSTTGSFIDLSTAQQTIQEKLNTDNVAGRKMLREFSQAIKGLGLYGKVNFISFRDHFASINPEYARLMDMVGLNVINGDAANNQITTNVNVAAAVDGKDGNDMIVTGSADDVIYGGNGDDTIQAGNGGDRVYAEAGNDYVFGGEGNDLIYGGDGDDTLDGNIGSDVLYGGAGNDTLYGNDSSYENINDNSDILDGGEGNDRLFGGTGNDTYIFGRGYGKDIIRENKGVADTIMLKGGIMPEDIVLKRQGSNLIISIRDTTDELTIESQFYAITSSLEEPYQDMTYHVERLQFADGTIWNYAKMREEAEKARPTETNDSLQGYERADMIHGLGGDDYLYGAGENDTLYGDEGNDTLEGAEGADTLYGGNGNDILRGDSSDSDAGNDILDGGAGNDSLYGGMGTNTYVFGRGYGSDWVNDERSSFTNIIRLQEGISPNDIKLSRWNSQLKVTIKDTSESLTIAQQYQTAYDMLGRPTTRENIASIRFADGTIWNSAVISEKLFSATEGNDDIMGFETDDVIHGLGGDDYMQGVAGSDTLYGDDGNDTLYGGDGNDVLYGGLGSDKVYGDMGDDVIYGGDQNDMLYGNEGNDFVEGDDGDDYLYGNIGNDTLVGGGGNDGIYGGEGNDILKGGVGNDSLQGEAGSDTYWIGLNEGNDMVYDHDGWQPGTDVINFGDTYKNLIFTNDSSQLYITQQSSQTKTTVGWWYSGTNYQIEQFVSSDGHKLNNTQVDQLIQVMATFSAQNNGMTWSQAIDQRPQDVQNILSQFWVQV